MKAILAISICFALAAAAVRAQAPQTGAGQPAPKVAPGATPAGFEGSAYGKAREIPARIVSFTAEPATIKAGQTFTLVWHTENPSGVTVDPEPGRVTPRGSRLLKPSATTTYTLTARGPNNQVLTKTVTVTVTGTTGTASRPDAGAAAKKAVPRTADGKPDLTGVYGGGGGGGARGAAPGAGAPAAPV